MAELRKLEYFILHDVKHLGNDQNESMKLEIDGVICNGKVLESLLQNKNDVVLEKFVRKCQVMSELRHPNIQKFMGVCFVPGSSLPILAVQRFDTSLEVFLESTPEISLRCKCSILHDVAQGLAYLHGRTPPVILGELNTKNILLDSDMTARISASYLLDLPTGDDDGTHYTTTSAEDDVASFGQMAICLLHPEAHTCRTDALCDVKNDIDDNRLLMPLLQRCLIGDCRPSIQQVVEQLESTKSDLMNSNGKSHLVQLLADSEDSEHLDPEMEDEVPGDLTAVFESALTTQAKSKDGPKHDAQSPLQPSNSHTSLHVSYSEPISSSKHEPSFPEANSLEDSHESVTDSSSTGSRNSSSDSSSSGESVSVTISIEPTTEYNDEIMSEHQAPKRGVYSSLIARRHDLMQEFEKKSERFKELLLQEMQITGVPPRGLTADEIEKLKKKLGVNYKFSKLVMGDSESVDSEDGNVDDLERQLEIQSTIIEASKDLLSRTNDRWLKKGRKKGIRQAEKKFLKLEEKLQKKKRTSGLSSSVFYVDLPPQACRRKSLDLTATGSLDLCGSSESNLTKLSLHRSTSALNEMDSSHTHVSATQSLVYHAMFAFH